MPSIRFPSYNPSKFVFVLCVGVFSVLLALRLDLVIVVDYGMVFIPMWILGALSLAGSMVGIIYWLQKDPKSRGEPEKKEFHQMLSVSFGQLMLLTFCILVVVNLQRPLGEPLLNWGAIFLPILIISFISVFLFFYWKLFSRPAMYEGIFGLGLLFFLFLSLQISGRVAWNWASVFSPVWIVFVVLFLYVIYLWIMVMLQPRLEMTLEEKFLAKARAVDLTAMTIPSFTFAVLLVLRLQGSISSPFTLIFIPLFILFAYLLWTCFLVSGGNPWWFAQGDGLFQFVRSGIPKFGEVSFTLAALNEEPPERGQPPSPTSGHSHKQHAGGTNPATSSIPPYISIELPE